MCSLLYIIFLFNFFNTRGDTLYAFLLLYFFIDLLIRESVRARAHAGAGGWHYKREKKSQADSSLSVEPSISHDPEITTGPEIKNGMLNPTEPPRRPSGTILSSCAQTGCEELLNQIRCK